MGSNGLSTSLRRASALSPGTEEVERFLASLGKVSREADPGGAVAELRMLEQLARNALRAGDLDAALRRFLDAGRALDAMPLPLRHLARPAASPAVVSLFKLAHDLQQFRYLVRRRVLPASFLKRVSGHARLLDEMLEGGEFFRAVDDALARRLGPAYGRLVHSYRPGPAPGGALNPSLDFARIERDFRSGTPPVAVIDGVLSREALSRLRRMALESVMWHDVKLPGYLGVRLDHGLACGLVFQIARELRERLPSVLGKLPFQTAWAFKYAPGERGIGVHADGGAVTLNLWITPDRANLDPDSGGLTFYDARPPADWAFEDYTAYDTSRVRRRLEASGARWLKVSYRANRGVLFDAKLFHGGDGVRFRDDHVSRRVNLAFLFG